MNADESFSFIHESFRSKQLQNENIDALLDGCECITKVSL